MCFQTVLLWSSHKLLSEAVLLLLSAYIDDLVVIVLRVPRARLFQFLIPASGLNLSSTAMRKRASLGDKAWQFPSVVAPS